jgi:hypothetical protein
MFGDRLFVAAEQGQIAAIPVPAERVVGIELEPAAEFAVRARPVPVVPGVGGGERVVRARQAVVELECFQRGGFASRQRFFGRDCAIGARDDVGVGQAGIGRREALIVRDRFLKCSIACCQPRLVYW